MDNDTNSQSYDESLPVVVVLGDFAHEGLTAKIQSLGFTVINRRFRYGNETYLEIAAGFGS